MKWHRNITVALIVAAFLVSLAAFAQGQDVVGEPAIAQAGTFVNVFATVENETSQDLTAYVRRQGNNFQTELIPRQSAKAFQIRLYYVAGESWEISIGECILSLPMPGDGGVRAEVGYAYAGNTHVCTLRTSIRETSGESQSVDLWIGVRSAT